MDFVDNRMTRLEGVFSNRGLSISIKSEYIVVEKSRYEFGAIINKIVGLDICTFISKNRINDNLVFTITPYKIPDFFEPDCLMNDENSAHEYTYFSEIQFAVYTNSVNTSALLRFIKKEEDLEITQNFYRSQVGLCLHRYVGTPKWDGKSMLHISAMKGNLLAASCILTLTGDKYVNLKDMKKKSPLDRAISCKDKENGFRVARELISFGADIHYLYKNRTLFKWALIKKNYSIACLLAKRGAKAKEITNMVLFILGQFDNTSRVSELPNELRYVIGSKYLEFGF